MVDTILLTGGTGKTGRLLGERLRARGVAVRVATRSPSASDQVRLDWDDGPTHAAALAGVDAVYLVAPTDRTAHLSAMRPFLERAVAQGVGPLVLLSASSLEEGGPMMGEVHAWLRAHAPRWTALRPSWFMQNFVTQHLRSILDEDCLYSSARDGRVPFIDAADIADVAAVALTEHDRAAGEQVLTGPAAYSYDEVADMISSVVGRTVRHIRLSAEALARRYESFGLPQSYAALLAGMDEALATGAEDRITDTVERVVGRAPSTFSDFLSEQEAIFTVSR